MQYTANTKPGMGDPYWYEWSVGLQYIIDITVYIHRRNNNDVMNDR